MEFENELKIWLVGNQWRATHKNKETNIETTGFGNTVLAAIAALDDHLLDGRVKPTSRCDNDQKCG